MRHPAGAFDYRGTDAFVIDDKDDMFLPGSGMESCTMASYDDKVLYMIPDIIDQIIGYEESFLSLLKMEY